MQSRNKIFGRTLAIFLVFFFSISLIQANAQMAAKPVIVGYVGGYKGLVDMNMIHPSKLTYINYAFVNVIANRAVLTNLKTDTINLKNLAVLKKKDPSLKVLISIGGWSWSKNFSDAVLSDTSRKAFAQSAIAIVRKFNLDGIDIDWEYPGSLGAKDNIYRSEDKQNYTLLFRSLREALDTLQNETGRKMLLTAAVGGFPSFLHTTDMGKAQQYLDYVNLMTYDLDGGALTQHHTSLLDADRTIKAFAAAGVPYNKMLMGIAFYGHSYIVKKDSNRGLGDSIVTHGRGYGYSYIKDSLIGYHYYRDRHAKAAYWYNPTNNEFITADDTWSVKLKCQYVLYHKMAGVMFWEYVSDPKEYLLDEIDNIIK
ncbi:glycoside hydrolase family 18 protein [Arachidicoccus soli]|nr:glycoside hydrolase family 18 protein [Arachidicoccus soli]